MVFLGSRFKSFDTCDEINKLATHKPTVMKNMA